MSRMSRIAPDDKQLFVSVNHMYVNKHIMRVSTHGDTSPRRRHKNSGTKRSNPKERKTFLTSRRRTRSKIQKCALLDTVHPAKDVVHLTHKKRCDAQLPSGIHVC
jgi:hypothetical protein